MPITTLDQYIGSPKQRAGWVKTATRTTVALFPFTLFDLAGQPGAGALAIGNTANGIVPVAGQPGYPAITAFGGGANGHLTVVDFASSVVGRLHLYDRLFAAGAYAFNADVTLASQPSYAGRVLGGGTNFRDLEIWVEQVTAATGNQAVNVFYTNEAGTAGRQTGATGIGAAPTVGRCWQLPLQAGDSGVQRIERVVGTVASAGTFNVMVLRPLWTGVVIIAGLGDVHDLLRTGMPEVFATSALYVLATPTGTSSGVPVLNLEIANG